MCLFRMSHIWHYFVVVVVVVHRCVYIKTIWRHHAVVLNINVTVISCHGIAAVLIFRTKAHSFGLAGLLVAPGSVLKVDGLSIFISRGFLGGFWFLPSFLHYINQAVLMLMSDWFIWLTFSMEKMLNITELIKKTKKNAHLGTEGNLILICCHLDPGAIY